MFKNKTWVERVCILIKFWTKSHSVLHLNTSTVSSAHTVTRLFVCGLPCSWVHTGRHTHIHTHDNEEKRQKDTAHRQSYAHRSLPNQMSSVGGAKGCRDSKRGEQNLSIYERGGTVIFQRWTRTERNRKKRDDRQRDKDEVSQDWILILSLLYVSPTRLCLC